MNTIETKVKSSMYEIYDVPFDDIVIDGISIDAWLDSTIPNRGIKGLAPTTSGWLMNKHDEKIVWDRLFPADNQTTICPILICPDDNDFWCTTIVVEIEAKGDFVYWNRFGLNKKYEFEKYDTIGSDVEWFQSVGRLKFNANEYSETFNLIKERNMKPNNGIQC